jgi:RimJ/RimL family protein N-acetyltransferase
MHDTKLHDRLKPAVTLPKSLLDSHDFVSRPRSAGPLSHEEAAYCRAHGIGLAYDPVHIGWVVANCVDDVDGHGARGEKPVFYPRSMAPTYRFRPWTVADVAAYRALLDDPAVWAMMYEAYPNPLDEDLARDLIELSAASDHHEVLAVLRNGEIVGQVRMLFEAGPAPKTAEFSYWFGRAHWGKGLGSAIVSIHSGQTFVQHPGLASIFAVVHPDNTASRKVLRKAGYVEEGPDSRRPGWISYRLTRARAEAINSGSGPT